MSHVCRGMAKKKPKGKKGFTVCADCGGQYKIGAPHYMFCPAKSCEECGTTFSHIIEKGGEGRRLCENCDDATLP